MNNSSNTNQKLVLRVCCAVIRADERFLLVQRPEHKAEPLQWEFPGGKVEPGESDGVCIEREIREELGVTLHIHGRLRTCRFMRGALTIELLPFLTSLATGPVVLHEHKDLRWLPVDELLRFDLGPADRDIAMMLQNPELTALRW